MPNVETYAVCAMGNSGLSCLVWRTGFAANDRRDVGIMQSSWHFSIVLDRKQRVLWKRIVITILRCVYQG